MPPGQPLSPLRTWRPGLTTGILAGLALGAAVGALWPQAGIALEPLGQIFIRLVLMMLAPLIFAALVVAVSAGGSLRAVGSVAYQTLGFAFLYTALMLGLGLLLGAWIQPGVGVALGSEGAAAVPLVQDSIWLRLVPSSALDAMARNDVLQIVVFSLLFGVAVNLVGEKGTPVRDFCGSLLEVMFKLTRLVMYAAPLGVAGAAAAVVGRHGLSIGESFVRLAVATYLGLAVAMLIVMPVLLALARVPLGRFVRAAREPFLLAFSTTSSPVAWPLALANLERLGVSKTVASFALFTGSLNLSGSSLFIGVAGSFLLQAAGAGAPAIGAFALFVTLFLAGKAAFGPRGSLVALAAALMSAGMDPGLVAAGFALLVGLDPLLDMPRTGVNLLGSMTTACLVSRWQGGDHTAARP